MYSSSFHFIYVILELPMGIPGGGHCIEDTSAYVLTRAFKCEIKYYEYLF